MSKNPHRQAAFTLTELLVAISIAAMISAMSLTAMYSAQQSANEGRTRSIVTKVNELLLQQWADVETRRLAYQPILSPRPPDPRFDPNLVPRQRLYYQRQLMRLEFPERKSDLLPPREYSLPRARWEPSTRLQTARYKGYLRTLARLYPSAVDLNDILTNSWSAPNQHSECLYLILSSTRIDDGNALDFFAESEIGDTDGDGMKEILDSWGNPIVFLRWAPGHLEAGGIAESIQSGDWTVEPDGFDPLKADYMWNDNKWIIKPYQLYPLVLSAGRDGEYDILFDFDVISGDPNDAVVYSNELSDTSGSQYGGFTGNNPYVVRCFSNPSRGLPDNDCGISDITEFFNKAVMIGMSTGVGADDNISNQQAQVR